MQQVVDYVGDAREDNNIGSTAEMNQIRSLPAVASKQAAPGIGGGKTTTVLSGGVPSKATTTGTDDVIVLSDSSDSEDDDIVVVGSTPEVEEGIDSLENEEPLNRKKVENAPTEEPPAANERHDAMKSVPPQAKTDSAPAAANDSERRAMKSLPLQAKTNAPPEGRTMNPFWSEYRLLGATVQSTLSTRNVAMVTHEKETSTRVDQIAVKTVKNFKTAALHNTGGEQHQCQFCWKFNRREGAR